MAQHDPPGRTLTNPRAGRDHGSGGPSTEVEGSLLAGRFRLLRRLGQGGMGVVFEALDTAVGQEVAVKVLHPHLLGGTGRERLRREVRTARMSHPNLVTVFDLHEEGTLAFLVMELVHGESLKERLEREAPLPVEEVVHIGRDLAEALVSLHERGIVHRDVKPGNILLDRDTGRARLCDAGLARPVAAGTTVTETRMVVGTPAYMAPEQATGERPGTAVDVYALGAVLHECLSGEVPLADENALSTLMRRQKQRPPRLDRLRDGVPRWLARLVRRMLDPDPTERPTAAGVAAALETADYRPRPIRRHLAAAVALAVFGLLCAVGVTAFHRESVERIVTSGDAVRGVDAAGKTVWSVPLEPGQHRFLEADLTGDGRMDMVAASYGVPDGPNAGAGERWNPGVVTAVTRDGRVLTRFELGSLPKEAWRFHFRRRLDLTLWAADLDRDGAAEIVVGAHHTAFYPQLLLVYWPRLDRWRHVLIHPGWLYWVQALPPRDGKARLAFAAINNLLVRQRVFGVLEMSPPVAGGPSGAATRDSLTVAPLTSEGEIPDLDWEVYVPIGMPRAGAPRMQLLGERIRLSWGGRILTLDRFYNPVPGPNAGRDLRAMRLAFLRSLDRLAETSFTPDPASMEERFEDISRRFAPLLAEPPYRVILADREAVGLAERGAGERAIEILRPVVEATGSERLQLRLINLLAVAGRLDQAVQETWGLLDGKKDTGLGYDLEVMAHRLAVELEDRSMLERLVETMRVGKTSGSLENLRAAARYRTLLRRRARLWWDRVTAADTEPVRTIYDPAGPAITVLCRWRLGRIQPGDEAQARTLVDEAGGADGEGYLALAAARLALGRPRDALQVLVPLDERLQREGCWDFNARQLWLLCRALRARALLGAGDRAAARRVARGVLRDTRRGLLPADIAREVLEAAG